MKTYIMIHDSIVKMGGGQMYARNKACYMEENGWRVIVFSCTEGEVLIGELKNHTQYILPALTASPLVYSKKYVNKILELMSSYVDHRTECVIESGSPRMSLWGELLAQRLNCKHMAHLLNERLDTAVPSGYLPYFWFKWERRELSGINTNSLRILFRNDARLTIDKCYALPSVCQNVDSAEEDTPVVIPKSDHVVGCIGRLEKPYVLVAAKAYQHLVQNHPEDTYTVIFVGDTSNDQRKDEIRNLFSSLKNVKLVMPGFMYPIPQGLLNQIDVFVSSAGSASVTYRLERTTVAVDLVDNYAIGVLGYTTQNRSYRADEPLQDVAELLEKILYTDYLSQYVYTPTEKNVSLNKLQQHIEFLEQSTKEQAFFDVNSLRADGKDKRKRLCRVLLGTKGFLRVRPLLVKIVR